ncbi:MAG: outer membrane beta-barrel protein [Rhizobiaceae bacterium]
MTQITRLLATVALTALPFAALAADYDPPIVVDQPPEYQPVEIGNGWYLRGDIGYGVLTSTGAVNYRTYDAGTGTYSTNAFATEAISTNLYLSGGFGYRFTDWVRADATLDYFTGSFAGTTASALPCIDPLVDPAYAGTSCRSDDAATFTAYTTMINGYADLGTIAHLTPYVGAGAGLTYMKWDTLTNDTYCVNGIGACPAPAYIGQTTHAGLDSWRFTWALMAGVSYDLTKNTKLDLGYKYTRVAGGPMFAFDAASAGAGATGTQGTDGGYSQHQVRLGFRYELW